MKLHEIKKITFASSDKIEHLSKYVDKVLEILKHPEAFVSDRSTIWDFSPVFSDNKQKQKWLSEMSEKFQMPISTKDYIWEIAENLKNRDK